MNKKKNDIILIVAIAIVAVIIFLIRFLSKELGESVIVTVDGVEYGIYSLDEDKEIKIETKDNHVNVVVIKDGSVYMKEADCPDKICVNHKNISYNGETIVCLPHKVVVEVVSKRKPDVDSIAR